MFKSFLRASAIVSLVAAGVITLADYLTCYDINLVMYTTGFSYDPINMTCESTLKGDVYDSYELYEEFLNTRKNAAHQFTLASK